MTEYRDIRRANALTAVGTYQRRISHFCQSSASLSEYLVKGFVMDYARLKETGTDYFEELLARIRDIRSSERMFYQKILDIYGTSVDYDGRAETTQL